MNDDDLKDYAKRLILGARDNIEWMTIDEMWNIHGDREALSYNDQNQVYELLHTAKIEVSWE